MNTSDERGPGVPDELRGRLIQRLGSAKVLRTSAGEQVDAILAEIEAAGYRILARFEVTEKPVVMNQALGRMAVASSHWLSLDISCHAAMEKSFEEVGIQMQERLEARGLTIVRSGEAAR